MNYPLHLIFKDGFVSEIENPMILQKMKKNMISIFQGSIIIDNNSNAFEIINIEKEKRIITNLFTLISPFFEVKVSTYQITSLNELKDKFFNLYVNESANYSDWIRNANNFFDVKQALKRISKCQHQKLN